jgi:hypothetical protein
MPRGERYMSRLLAALSLVLLAACATKPLDFIPQEGTIQRTVTWVMTEYPTRSCDRALGKALIGTRNACARLRGSDCTIYVKPPRSDEDRTAIFLLGHEALHCFVGHFHYAIN